MELLMQAVVEEVYIAPRLISAQVVQAEAALALALVD
jgi:hypothetical protein